jgi:transcriptional regulator GlxA family with amidase domain
MSSTVLVGTAGADRSPRSDTLTFALHQEAVTRAVELITRRYREPLTLEDMARVAILSRCYFNRVFRKVTGVPPRRFLAAVRFAAAKRLLLTSPVSVVDVCMRVGYTSLGTFTSRFTESVSLTPSQFREAGARLPASAPDAPRQGSPRIGGRPTACAAGRPRPRSSTGRRSSGCSRLGSPSAGR